VRIDPDNQHTRKTMRLGRVVDRKRVEENYTDPKFLERALLFGLVPIALRLATLRFDRDINQDLGAFTSAMEQLSPELNDPWQQVAQFLRSMFSGEKTWRQWHDEIAPPYAGNRWALGILASLASVLDSPLLQSLVSQIGLARTLEQVFKISSSIPSKLWRRFSHVTDRGPSCLTSLNSGLRLLTHKRATRRLRTFLLSFA
jgi:hypothetical protein